MFTPGDRIIASNSWSTTAVTGPTLTRIESSACIYLGIAISEDSSSTHPVGAPVFITGSFYGVQALFGQRGLVLLAIFLYLVQGGHHPQFDRGRHKADLKELPLLGNHIMPTVTRVTYYAAFGDLEFIH